MKDVYVVESARTPVARAGKQSWFANIRADELSAIVMRELRNRVGLEDKTKQAAIIDDVVWAATSNALKETGNNAGRVSWLLSDGAYEVPACTVDRMCASSLNAIELAAASMMSGMGGEVMFAGGAQHMSHIPMIDGVSFHPDLGKYVNLDALYMGYTAEIVARRFNQSREQQDEFAMISHQKCAMAQDANGGLGKTKDIIIPIEAWVPKKSYKNDPLAPAPAYIATEYLANEAKEKGEELEKMVLFRDQGLRRDTTMESLAKMPTAFMQDEKATVTAGNSSQTNDAAAGVVLATEEGCKLLDRKPVYKIVSWAVVGCEPDVMGIAPTLAIPKALKRAGLTQKDIGLWEINEAFASQARYCCVDALKLPMDRVNVWGSGISIGHPLACTGARIAADVVALFKDPDFSDVEYIVESMCIGHGHGAAMIFQRAK